jgi:hypothetical protein
MGRLSERFPSHAAGGRPLLCAPALLCIGLAIALASGYTKADTAESAEPAKSIMLASPGLVSLDQAIAAMGTEARYRFVLRWPPFVRSGFLTVENALIPQDQRRIYEQFVTASGFDLNTRWSGALFYGDCDFSESERATMVFGLNGVIPGKVLDELMKLVEDDADDDTDDDTDAPPAFHQVVVLAQLSPEVRDKLLAFSKKLDPSETETVGDGTVAAQPEGKGLYYAYLWHGGIVIGYLPTTSVPPLVAAKTVLAPLLAELRKAAAAHGQPSDLAIEGRGSEQGIAVTFSARIAQTVVADATITLRAADVAKVKKVLNKLPAVRANPDATFRKLFEGRNPVAQRLLAAFVLKGTTIELKGREVVVHIEADTEQLKARSRPLLADLFR